MRRAEVATTRRMDKQARQSALLSVLRRRPASSQQSLVEQLHKRGFRATQASISRDLRELGLLKVEGRYVSVNSLNGAALPGAGGLRGELITAVQPIGANLVVVRTPAGMANALGVALDGLSLSDLAGTIAGDDTLFLAVPSRAAQGRVCALLRGAMARRPRAGSVAGPQSAPEFP